MEKLLNFTCGGKEVARGFGRVAYYVRNVAETFVTSFLTKDVTKPLPPCRSVPVTEQFLRKLHDLIIAQVMVLWQLSLQHKKPKQRS